MSAVRRLRRGFQVQANAVITPGGMEITREAEAQLDLNAGQRLLSVACGLGEVELYLAAKYGCRITGIDLVADFITRAQSEAAARGLAYLADFQVGDANDLDLPDASFDLVWCSGALFTFLERGLPEISRVLKRDGLLVVTDLIWRQPEVPESTVLAWTTGHGPIFTLNAYAAYFRSHGYDVLHQNAYHRPEWWATYYRARGKKSHWLEEHARYQQDEGYLGLGLFILRHAGH